MTGGDTDQAPRPAHRWLRMYFKFSDAQASASEFRPHDELAQFPAPELPNELLIAPDDPRRELGRVKSCIYCDAKEFIPGSGLPLSEEHFVAEGLGSRLVLLEASCQRCANKTRYIEERVLRTLLWVPRVRMKVRRKKRKRKEDAFPVVVMGPDRRDVLSHSTLEEHPSVLFLPRFNPPGILTKQEGGSGFAGPFIVTLTELPKPGYPEFASAAVDTALFSQLLAKIAHGFAISELGTSGFSALLPEFIRADFGGDNSLSHYRLVGGDPRVFAPSVARHSLGWGVCRSDDIDYLLVAVRLFADLGSPLYYVVTETLDQEQLAKARALTEARARARDIDLDLSR